MSSVNIDEFVASVTRRLEAIEAKLDATETTDVSARGGEQSSSLDSSALLLKYDTLFQDISELEATSALLDGKLEKMVKDMRECFSEVRGVLELAQSCRKPKESEVNTVLQPLTSALKQLQKNRLPAGFVNHEKSILEGAPCIMWVSPTVGAPVPYLESMRDASVFYANKVRISSKGGDKGDVHMKWCTQLNQVFQSLIDFVEENQKLGLEWNPRGKSPVDDAGVGAGAGAGKSSPQAKKQQGSAAANLFAELSKIDQSSGKTAGLRHVSDDMKAKNQKDRSFVVKATAKPPTKGPTARAKAGLTMKDPVFELKGNKWTIEYQRDGVIKTIEADQLGIKRTVYIYKCAGCTIVLKGKCNNITLDSCHDVQLLFDNVVGACEIVNCQKVKVQANVAVPTVSIDKCDGAIIYLMQRDILPNVQLVTSKSSEINVSWPSSNPEENFIERPIPEQFVSKIVDDGTIDTQVSDLYSH